MVAPGAEELRKFLNLIEEIFTEAKPGKNRPGGKYIASKNNDHWQDLEISKDQHEWSIRHGPLFDETLRNMTRVFPDLPDKLEKFIDLKVRDPLRQKYGKHDSSFTSDTLRGFWHCHLRDDAVLIYRLERNKVVNLVGIFPHAELEGKRLRKTVNRIVSVHG